MAYLFNGFVGGCDCGEGISESGFHGSCEVSVLIRGEKRRGEEKREATMVDQESVLDETCEDSFVFDLLVRGKKDKVRGAIVVDLGTRLLCLTLPLSYELISG
jgi:hypothetical protein